LAQTSPYPYKPRGEGATSRYEGVKSDPFGGSLTLLSFTIGRPDRSLPQAAVGQLRVRFYSPNALGAHLKVRELHSETSYLLDTERAWRAGQNEFAWPVDEVIQPLHVKLNNLGVVVGSNPGMSGTVFPARLTASSASARESRYAAVVRSKYSCAPLLGVLSRRTAGYSPPIARLSYPKVPALAPKVLEFDVSKLEEGQYSLRISCERKGMGPAAGRDSDQFGLYDFFHRPAFLLKGQG